MPEKIERFKDQSEWSTDEVLANRRTGAIPENPEYTEARRKALERAGLEDEDDAGGLTDEDGNLTTAGYLRDLQARGGRP